MPLDVTTAPVTASVSASTPTEAVSASTLIAPISLHDNAQAFFSPSTGASYQNWYWPPVPHTPWNWDSSPQAMVTPPMTTPPRPWAWGNPVSQNTQHPNSNPYKIYVKSGNISIFNGCCNKFTDSDKIVVQHQEYRSFTSPKTGLDLAMFIIM